MRQASTNVRFHTVLFWVCLALLVVLSFFILRPFIIPMVSAFVLAYLARPIYVRIRSVSNKPVAAIVSVLLILGILIAPIALIGTALFKQTQDSLDAETIETTITERIASIEFLDNFNIDLAVIKERVLTFMLSMLTSSLSQIPSIVISLVITVLGMYYMLANWENLVSKIRDFIPFRNKDKIVSGIALTTRNIIYGYILIAILEFIVAAIGFYIAGVELYLLLPALIAMLAFIPGLGPAVVWIPTFLFMLVSGDYYAAIVVLITGLIITILIETILSGKITGERASIHPLMMLIGILGGVPLFGIFGFIIGPLILAYTLKILEESLDNS